jgi:hypothetical protein
MLLPTARAAVLFPRVFGRRARSAGHSIAPVTKSSYRVDPVTDLRYAQEFMAAPVGLHSPGLQRVLNAFRGEPLAGKYVLVEEIPHQRWRLARLTGERGKAVPVLDTVFTDLLTAEREVFRLRWREHTGQDLDVE